MNTNHHSLEAAMRGINRGQANRIARLESELLFWRWYGIGMSAICIIITALKYK